MLCVTCPDSLRYLWEWFADLCETRPHTMEGVGAISYQEIAAWRELTGESPTPNDVSVIKQLDRISREK